MEILKIGVKLMRNKTREKTQPRLLKIFEVFFRIGLFTFGGGLAMMPVIQHELTSRGWIDDEDFLDSLSMASAIPGALAVNLSLLSGYRIRGIAGAASALLGVVLPSFFVIISIVFFFQKYFQTPAAINFFRGAGAAVAGLIAFSALDLGKAILKNQKHVFLTLLGISAGLFFRINPILIIILSAAAGYFWDGGDYNGATDI